MPGYLQRWNGDVYRTIVRLRTRSDLQVVVLDADEGLGLVTRGVTNEPLPLTDEEIDALTYDDLARDRQRLLGLRPPSELDEILDQLRR
jgi:hypothetical protein